MKTSLASHTATQAAVITTQTGPTIPNLAQHLARSQFVVALSPVSGQLSSARVCEVGDDFGKDGMVLNRSEVVLLGSSLGYCQCKRS